VSEQTRRWLVVLLLLAGCSLESNTVTGWGRRPGTIYGVVLDVDLRNEDTAPIHILTLGEGYEPSNLLSPGAHRNVRVTVDFAGFWMAPFRAGRDGMDLAGVVCRYSRPYERPLGPAAVVWDGTQLACLSW
jgi:hypothetical protein